MSKVRFVCAATLVLAVCSHVHAYTLYASNNGPYLPYRVQKFDLATGACADNFTSGYTWFRPKDLAIGPDGSLYVCDRDTPSIVRFNAQTGAFINIFATSPVPRAPFAPQVIEFGPDGNLYVSDYSSVGRVLRYNGQTGAFMDVFVTGVSTPAGMQFGPDGNLYVGSYNDNAVYRFNPVTGASLGKFASISHPEEIRFGPDGNLYVVSFDALGGAGLPGNGVYRFNGQTGVGMGLFADYRYGYGLQFAPNGDLYVSGYHSGNGITCYDGATGAFKENVRSADGTRALGGYFLITPEPASIALLAIGGMLLRRPRCRCAARSALDVAS